MKQDNNNMMQIINKLYKNFLARNSHSVRFMTSTPVLHRLNILLKKDNYCFIGHELIEMVLELEKKTKLLLLLL